MNIHAGSSVASTDETGGKDLLTSSTDATRKLARHAASLTFEALPSALVSLVKQCVLDTLGVSVGASTLSAEARIVADYVKDMGGKAESTVLGFGGRVPAAWAAFAN